MLERIINQFYLKWFNMYSFYFPVVGKPQWDIGRLTVQVLRSHRPITLRRTTLDEVSARCRDLYLTTHNSHKRHTTRPSVGIKPSISACQRLQIQALDRATKGIGHTHSTACRKYK
jgi:hypothetical protein